MRAWVRIGAIVALSLGAPSLADSGAAKGGRSEAARAVTDPRRPADDRALDHDRHPAELLAYLRIHPGETIADVWPGDYWDRLFADAVGSRGRVYAVHLVEADKAEKTVTPAAGSSPLAGYQNVLAVVTSVRSIALPEQADVVWMRQNYHDLYDPFMGPADVRAFNEGVYRALRPGGRFVVVDHVAPAASGISSTNTTHRIDPAVVKRDMAAAGFRFVGESAVLRNPKDQHDVKVFDPRVRGRTDQFVYVFERPGR